MERSPQAVEDTISFRSDCQIWMHTGSAQALVVGSHDSIALRQPCIKIIDVPLRAPVPGWGTNIGDANGAMRPRYDGPTATWRRTLWKEHGSRNGNGRFAVNAVPRGVQNSASTRCVIEHQIVGQGFF